MVAVAVVALTLGVTLAAHGWGMRVVNQAEAEYCESVAREEKDPIRKAEFAHRAASFRQRWRYYGGLP